MKKPTLLLPLLLLPLSSVLAADNPPSTPSQSPAAQQEELSPAAILAGEVKEIASSTTLSRKAQAKLITNAVRTAVGAVIEGIKNPADRLKAALELATAAAQSAPHFAATITRAITSIPALAAIDGALEQIQSAVSDGVAAADKPDIANPATNPPRPPATPEFGGPNNSETVVSPSH
jgi:hypothetical protein